MIELPPIPPLDDRSEDVIAACAAVRRSGHFRYTAPAMVRPTPALPRGVARAWFRPMVLGVALLVVLALAGALLAGCASEPVRRLAAHMARDAGAAAAAHPDDPAAARLVTATAALGALVGPPDGPVAVADFEADVAAVRDESTARGCVGAALESAGAGLGTLAAGVLGTIVAVLVGPTVARRVGSAASAAKRWAETAARRLGVPEEVVESVADAAVGTLAEAAPRYATSSAAGASAEGAKGGSTEAATGAGTASSTST